MRRLLALCGTALALSTTAASAQVTTLTFDDLTNDFDAMPALYGGITWASQWGSFVSPQAPYNPHSGATRLLLNYTTDPNNPEETYTPVETFFDFSTPVSGVSAWFAGETNFPTDPNQVAFNFYFSGLLVYTSSALTLSGVPILLDGSAFAGQVDRVGVYASRGWVVMDDLSFTSSAQNVVPEPATMTLLATGLAGMAAGARRRRKV